MIALKKNVNIWEATFQLQMAVFWKSITSLNLYGAVIESQDSVLN